MQERSEILSRLHGHFEAIGDAGMACVISGSLGIGKTFLVKQFLEDLPTAQEEVYRQWYDAVEHVAEKLLGEHGLELLAMKHTRKVHANHRPHQLKVIPTKSWTGAADKIRETLNGVGTFYFNDLKEFLDSGPYTARQAVLAHLRTVQSYPAVYGAPGANQLYDQY